jgi:site-specific DNA-cytosine methylase
MEVLRSVPRSRLKTVVEPKFGKKTKELLLECPPGTALRKFSEDVFRPKHGEGSTIRIGYAWIRLHPERPSGTVLMNPPIHPTEPRLLAVEEMKALCGYPLDYELLGLPIVQAGLLSRGVMPPVGAWLAENVKRSITRGKLEDGPRAYLVEALRKPLAVKEIR